MAHNNASSILEDSSFTFYVILEGGTFYMEGVDMIWIIVTAGGQFYLDNNDRGVLLYGVPFRCHTGLSP